MLKVVANNGQANPYVDVINEDGVVLLKVTACSDGMLVSGSDGTFGLRNGVRLKQDQDSHTVLEGTDGHLVATIS